MEQYLIDSNESFKTVVTVRESDKYTQAAYVRFDRHDITEDTRGVNEMFMTPEQLDQFGRFMIRQAEYIRNQQSGRKFDERVDVNTKFTNSGKFYQLE